MEKLSCGKSVSSKEYSEFADGGYNRSLFCVTVKKYLDIELLMQSYVDRCVDRLVSELNCFFENNALTQINNSFNFSFGEKYVRKYLLNENQDIYFLDVIGDEDGKVNTLDVINELRPLNEALKNLCEENRYDDSKIEKYLNSFFSVSKKLVFNPNNLNLNSLMFRRLKTVENLNCLGRIPLYIQIPGEKEKESVCSYFSIYSPYVADTVMRIVHDLSENKGRIYVSGESEMLSRLRVEVYLKQVERAFTRFTSYNNSTVYRVTLNRHDGEIISVPYNGLSSIEEIKPLRLFEKLAVYIKREAEKMKSSAAFIQAIEKPSLSVKISIIGHTEMSVDRSTGKKDERELSDLLTALVNWYSRSFDFEYPNLNLRIDNYVSKDDAPYAEDVIKQGRYNLFCDVKNNHGVVNIYSCNFGRDFYFTSSGLEEICNENDVIFILDCPWLSVESYEIKNNGYLKYYCRDVQDETLRNKENDAFDNSWQTAMQRLSTNYNRITSSDTDKSGDIARIFFDSLLRRISGFADSANKNTTKEIYLFTSEMEGVNYSLLATHPLTRTELYGGKHFTIAKFTNQKTDIITCNKKSVKFKIRLWSVLKYISISYAIENMKNILKRYFGNYITENENYFEIMRDILIFIEVDNTFTQLDISLHFSEKLDVFAKSIMLPKEKLSSIKNDLYGVVLDFVMSLYSGVVFADNNNFGDSIIKTAFQANIYSDCHDVSDVLFLHQYKQAHKNNDLSSNFRIHRKENPNITNESDIDNDSYSHEYFMDKKLYDTLFDILETTGELSTGTKAMLFSANGMYKTNEFMPERVLQNIIKSCEAHGFTDGKLYTNAKYALSDL